jgi:hypothetical protein
MQRTRTLLIVALAATAVALVACGDGNPAGPSGTAGVSVKGVLLGEGASFTASSNNGSGSGPITVLVEGTSISVTVSGNGTWEMEDVPPGTFTLVFLQDDTEIGRITITAAEGVEVKVVVQKKGAVIVLVDLELDDGDDDDEADSTCMIHGGRVPDGIELEGDVVSGDSTGFEMLVNGNRGSDPVTVDTSGANFKCNGKTGGDDCPGAVKSGAKVHVRGTLTSCTMSEAVVEASEVKVQKEGDDDD